MFEPDIALALGLLIGLFAIPSMMSALSDLHVPRTSTVAVLFAGSLIVYAMNTAPDGYQFKDIPYVVIKVIARVL